MKLAIPSVDETTPGLTPHDLAAPLDQLGLSPRLNDGPARLLIAVSGGPDSLALLTLASGLSHTRYEICAATVDHRLRPEAASEALYVAGLCRDLGVAHTTLRWTGWNGTGNLQACARNARYKLLEAEAVRIGAAHVVTAHHADDQLETVLHAIERGERTLRLAGMRPRRALGPCVDLLRPCLEIPRDRLHATLAKLGIAAVQDPGNDDDGFARIRHRRAIARMNADERAKLERVRRRAARRRSWLDRALGNRFGELIDEKRILFQETGTIALSYGSSRDLTANIQPPVLSRMLTAVGGGDHAPDRSSVERLSSWLCAESGEWRLPATATLAGVKITIEKSRVTLAREFGRSGPSPIAAPFEMGPILFDRRFDLVLSDAERAWAGERGAVLAGYGATGRGAAHLRPLPVLIAPDGDILAAHPEIARREMARGRIVHRFDTISCRIRWRCLADLSVGFHREKAEAIGAIR